MSGSADGRLYGALIALVSGTYSVASSVGDGMGSMPMSDSIMLIIGLVVILHGIALLTPLADRLGGASGPLMLLWAAIMLGNQAVAATSSAGRMVIGSKAWDGGMVALALLMLASGLIMIRAQSRT